MDNFDDDFDHDDQFVVGFCFSSNYQRLALIRKNRPEWQAGLCNGIGGHIKHGETPAQAMQREFHEETGVNIENWTHRFDLAAQSGFVSMFSTSIDDLGRLKTMTDEKIVLAFTYGLHMFNVIPNLRWIVPLLADVRIQESLGIIFEKAEIQV